MKQLLLTLSLSILFIPFGISQGTTNRNSDMILPHATSVESNTSIRDTIGTLIESNSTNTDGYDKFTGFQSQVNGTSGINYAIQGINFGNFNYRNYGIRGDAKNAENLNVGVVGTSKSEIGSNYAVWGIASESPGQNRGVIGYATQPTEGQNYGVTGWVGGSEQFNIAIGGYADAADSTNGWNAGLDARASATTENGINYGARTEARNAPTNYGVHAVANGDNAVSNIGIYASASNGQSNKAAVFEGEVDLVGNPIKNIANPVDDQDAVSLAFLLEKINTLQNQIDVLQSTSGSGTVTDQDGNSYTYLTYGDQIWTVKNAEMVTYRDGTPIPQVTDATEWANLTTGAWCYYDNDPSKGKLYNWYAVAGIHDNDPNTPNKHFAPEGWHVPTDAEWTELENYLIANGYNYDETTTGNKIAKSMASKSGWNDTPDTGQIGHILNRNNSSGFNAFPDGYRLRSGEFLSRNDIASFWSSTITPADGDNAYQRSLGFSDENLFRGNNFLKNGISVRLAQGNSINVVVEQSDLVGQWVLLHEAKALWVGETMEVYAAGGQWWSNSLSDIKTRACFFDDIYEFKDDMSFHNILGDATWQEGGWDAVAEEGCGDALAPFDGTATATWSHNTEDGTITLDGMGAFLGISRVANGVELTDPAQAKESLTYSDAVISDDKNQLTVNIQMGAGFWQFKFARVGSAGAELPTTDVDGDGVLDVDDDCPDVYGEAANGCPVVATPDTAPAAPTRDQSEVSSIYSDSYTGPENFDPYPNWGQYTQFAAIDIDGNNILGYSQLNYQGNAFSGVDLAGKTMIHMDIYSADLSALKVVLINTQADGGTFETGLDAALENGAWTSVDILLSDFTGFVESGGNLDQIKYEVGTDATATGDKSFFIDNIYVY